MKPAAEKIVPPLLVFAGLAAFWQLVASLGIYEPYLFPPPLWVARGMVETVANGELGVSVMASLFRFFTGYLTAALLAIPLGLVFGWYSRLWMAFDPLVQVLRPISPIAWFPLIGLWFGTGDAPAIVIIFIAAFYPILLSTVAAVRNVDQVYLKVAQNFGSSQRDILTKVMIPAAFPHITTGLHIALGSAWVFLVAGEMMGVRSGLGFLIVDARNQLRTELVMVGIIGIGLLGLCLDRLIGRLEKKLNARWGLGPRYQAGEQG
ncbi:MAG: ABC transporter permease [Syntrophothermus sp.]